MDNEVKITSKSVEVIEESEVNSKKDEKSDVDIMIEFYRRTLSLVSPFMLITLAIIFISQVLFYKLIQNTIILRGGEVIAIVFLIMTLLVIIKDFDSIKFKNEKSNILSSILLIMFVTILTSTSIIGVFNSTKLIFEYIQMDMENEKRNEKILEAKPITPEAKPITPEAKPITPEAKPITPEAKPITPEAKLITPETK